MKVKALSFFSLLLVCLGVPEVSATTYLWTASGDDSFVTSSGSLNTYGIAGAGSQGSELFLSQSLAPESTGDVALAYDSVAQEITFQMALTQEVSSTPDLSLCGSTYECPGESVGGYTLEASRPFLEGIDDIDIGTGEILFLASAPLDVTVTFHGTGSQVLLSAYNFTIGLFFSYDFAVEVPGNESGYYGDQAFIELIGGGSLQYAGANSGDGSSIDTAASPEPGSLLLLLGGLLVGRLSRLKN